MLRKAAPDPDSEPRPRGRRRVRNAPERVSWPSPSDGSRKGRGAVANPSGRYERYSRHATDSGWDEPPDSGDDEVWQPPRLRTTVTADKSRTIITRNESPDVGFDRSINPYRGCEHGCAYCFARPTHAWLGLSPGLDFESRLFAKPDAHRLLEAELAKPGYRCRTIAMGTNTDPYQPIERERHITRRILEVLAACDHPVSIVTKSALVARDLDLLAPMAAKGLAKVAVSVTTLDRGLARRLEPRAATPARRLGAIRALAEAGVPTAVMVAPVIPALTDHELEAILAAAREAGAAEAGWILLRLPLEVKELFADWLHDHVPLRAKRVLAQVRATRGGRLYQTAFGTRQRGSGEAAALIERRFERACARLGLNRGEIRLDTSRFEPPTPAGGQLPLF